MGFAPMNVGFVPIIAKFWRHERESNPRIRVLQTPPLPLGYRANQNFTIIEDPRLLNKFYKIYRSRDRSPPYHLGTVPFFYLSTFDIINVFATLKLHSAICRGPAQKAGNIIYITRKMPLLFF